MKKTKPHNSENAYTTVEQGLSQLFSTLNDMIGSIENKLDDDTFTGTVSRNHNFQTERGPLRAEAGVKLKFGGVDAQQPDRKTASDQPVATARPAPAQHRPTRDIQYEIVETAQTLTLTADMPGIAISDLMLHGYEGGLLIETEGPRHYCARIPMETQFDVGEINTVLRNGILTLEIPKREPS